VLSKNLVYISLFVGVVIVSAVIWLYNSSIKKKSHTFSDESDCPELPLKDVLSDMKIICRGSIVANEKECAGGTNG